MSNLALVYFHAIIFMGAGIFLLFRVFSGYFQDFSGSFQGVSLYALSGYVLWSGGRGCLGEGRLGVPGQVWEFRLLLSFSPIS